MAGHYCAVPYCNRVVQEGPRCPEHATPSRTRAPGSQAFYDSPRWRKLRAIVRRQQPLCQECRRAPSQSVDHVNGNLDDNRLENLRALCNPCHAKKSGRDHARKRSR